MTATAFDTDIEDVNDTIAGPWRAPQQMLAAQTYDDHVSIHDDAMAQKLGFKAATIEGPTHFSQLAPLCVKIWGTRWFEQGSISAHYRNAVFAGETVRAFLVKPKNGATQAAIGMHKEDGTEVLRGTASVGSDNPPSALDARLAGLEPLRDAVILRDVAIGTKTGRQHVCMNFDQRMGKLYPFSLADKLAVITEASPWYTRDVGPHSPWGRPIIPIEMISVLLQYTARSDRFPVRGPVVGLFADQEIRLLRGPLLVGETYEIEKEVVALSGSKRTESMWVRTRVYRVGSNEPVASMLLNSASLKDSYANYEIERRAPA